MAAMKTNPNSRKSTTLLSHVKYEHMVAGVSGGVTSTLILHPLDLIKIRFAGKFFDVHIFSLFEKNKSFFHLEFLVNDGRTNAPQYRGLMNAFISITRQEGIRGLYKGVTPNVCGSGSAWGFYFLL